MTKQELIFDNIKSLKTIASIEALGANTSFINDVLWRELCTNKSFFSKICNEFDLNLVIINQLNHLKLLLKDAELAVLRQKIKEKREVSHKSHSSELTEVNNVMRDIKMAISNANEDTSENGTQVKKVSSTGKNENMSSEITLSEEIKYYIQHNLNKILRENLDNIFEEIINIKKEKKSKVLDLSEVTVTPNIAPNK